MYEVCNTPGKSASYIRYLLGLVFKNERTFLVITFLFVDKAKTIET